MATEQSKGNKGDSNLFNTCHAVARPLNVLCIPLLIHLSFEIPGTEGTTYKLRK